MPDSVDTRGLVRRLERFQARGRSAAPLMAKIGQAVTADIRENFNQGGRPSWRPNAPSTIRQKGHARPLVGRGGRPSGLERSVVQVRANEVAISTIPAVRDFATIQQYGGRAGRNRSVRIPARPYRPDSRRPLPRRLRTAIGRLIKTFFRESA